MDTYVWRRPKRETLSGRHKSKDEQCNMLI